MNYKYVFSRCDIWKGWCNSGAVVKKLHFCNLGGYRFSYFLTVLQLTRCPVLHCAYLQQWRNQNQHDNHQYFNSPTALGPSSGSSRRHQPAIPEVASTQTCGPPCWAWLLSWLTGTSGVFKDHFSWLRLTGGCTFHKPVGKYRFSNVFIHICLIFLPLMGQAFANKIMNQKLYMFFTAFAASGFYPIINPPLLSAEARDATSPSLSGGASPLPHCRVSGLGGPDLVRSTLLQLRPSSFLYSEMTGWFHAALALTFWNEICVILTQRGAAHEVMVDETKPNSNCWNQWISRDCPISQCLPTKRLCQVSRHGSSLFFRKVPGKAKKQLLCYVRLCSCFQSWIWEIW